MQLTIFDIDIPEEEYTEIDQRTGNKYIYHHTKDEVIKIKKSLGTFWFDQEENADGTLTLTETRCKVNGEIIYE